MVKIIQHRIAKINRNICKILDLKEPAVDQLGRKIQRRLVLQNMEASAVRKNIEEILVRGRRRWMQRKLVYKIVQQKIQKKTHVTRFLRKTVNKTVKPKKIMRIPSAGTDEILNKGTGKLLPIILKAYVKETTIM